MCTIKIYDEMCKVSFNFNVIAIVRTEEVEKKYNIKLENWEKYYKRLFLR